MKKKSSIGIFCICVWLFLSSFAYAQNIAVIVNEKSPLLDELKSSLEIKEVRDIYLGKNIRLNGVIIKPLNQKNKQIISQFVEKVCGLKLNAYTHQWVKLEIETGMPSLKVVENSKEMIDYIQREPKSIGYVWENEVKDVLGIKVVLLLRE